MKRYKPLKRGRRVKPANGARKAQAFARNYGPEADALRLLPCAVHTHGNGKHRCSGPIEIAHVIEPRKMGGVGSDRFKILQVCRKAHRGMGERGTTMFEAFEFMFGVDLFALTDAAAVGHVRPLGIRGLADRWVQAQIGSGSLSEVVDWQLDAYELDALRGWVTRELAREVDRREERRCWPDDVEPGCQWDGLPDDDREALSHHIAGLLGGLFLEDPHGEHGLAWSLCEWATEGRWVS